MSSGWSPDDHFVGYFGIAEKSSLSAESVYCVREFREFTYGKNMSGLWQAKKGKECQSTSSSKYCSGSSFKYKMHQLVP